MKCGPAPQKIRIEFHGAQAQAVFIAGTFNEWNATAMPMLSVGDGRWVKELALPPGRYEYCLVADGEWRSDPAAAQQSPNVYGGFNSVLIVPALHEQSQVT